MPRWTWLLCLCLTAAACSRDRTQEEDRQETPDTGQADPGGPSVPDRPAGVGVAEVNGIPISRDEFLAHLEPYPDRMKESLQGREYVLQALVDQILLENEAKRLDLDRDPEFVRKTQSYRRNLLNNMLLDTVKQESFEVTPEEARAYFDSHPDEFDRPERIQARHILAATEEEAREWLAKIRAGTSFEQVAREHSRDSATKERGGDMGSFSASQRPDLAEAAFALTKPGQISGPVKTQRGFHLLQLVRRVPAEKQTFDQARENLLTRLRARKRQETKQKLLEKLREDASIRVDKQALEAIEIPATGESP